MPGILPEQLAGGIVIRDAAGNPTNPANVQNAHIPAPLYVSTCELTALPSDCTARIEARQINAIVSELISFAECLDPNGPWDCNSLRNLCQAFAAWVSNNQGASVDYVNQQDALRVLKSGDTMTGPLVLFANPTATFEAATKQYVDSIISGSGTAAVILVSTTPPAAPDNSLWWESDSGTLYIRYNDGNSAQWVIAASPHVTAGQFVTKTGDTMLGPLVLSGNPTQPLQAVTKQYADLALRTAGGQVVTGGFNVTPFNLALNGVVTPNAFNANYQYGTNVAAFTLTTPTADCAIDLLITNTATAGAVTFSGYTVGANIGDPLTTTDSHKFIVSIRRINAISTYTIKALQ